MTTRLNRVILLLGLLVGGPCWWLLFRNDPGHPRPYELHIAELRELADAMPGTKPREVEVELVASRLVPGTMVAAGIGLKRRPLAAAAYRLPVAGGMPIVIDTGMTATEAAAVGFDHYDAGAQARIDAAMDQAGLILATSELPPHLGGLAARARRPGSAAAVANAALPVGQLPPLAGETPAWPQGVQPEAVAVREGPRAVAPGVVAIPAPGHTPGAQMIFVALTDGREYLFTGDVATLEANWQQLRGRSRFASEWRGHEDREAVFRWLETIRQLKQEAPKLLIVPGHDFDWLWYQAGHRNIVAHFQSGN